MDPNANLQEMLRLASRLVEADDSDAARLAELVEALDGWIVGGGFLPNRWMGLREFSARKGAQ